MDIKGKSKTPTDISCTKEKIESTKKEILGVVESLLEKVSSDHLIRSCEKLSQADYADVVEERNIIDLCGYPLCGTKIKVPRQQYKIDYNTKKVYDITARKCFCSNECYKASNFVKSQLLEIPVWFQDGSVQIDLLQDCHNRGSAGEEVLIREKVSQSDAGARASSDLQGDCKKLLLDDLNQFADDFKDKLVVKEKNVSFSPVNTRSDAKAKKTSHSQAQRCAARKKPIKVVENDDDSTESSSEEDNGRKFFIDSKEELYPSHKLMPGVPARPGSFPILITPLPITVSMSPHVILSPVSNSFLQQLSTVLNEWVTLETYQFLLSEDGFSAADIEELFNKRNSDSVPGAVDLADMREKYLKLCMTLDKMEEEDKELDEKIIQGAAQEKAQEKELTAEEKLALFFSPNSQNMPNKQPKKARNRRKKSASKKSGQAKDVHAATSNDETALNVEKPTKKKSEEVSVESGQSIEKNTADPKLPMIDSVSQNALRRKMVISKLRIAFLDMLPLVGLHYKAISDDVRLLAASFRFSPSNISFRPVEWRVIALVLFRMLRKKFPENFCSDKLFESLLEKTVKDDVDTEYIDSIIMSIIRQ